jgi:hypothetical protein
MDFTKYLGVLVQHTFNAKQAIKYVSPILLVACMACGCANTYGMSWPTDKDIDECWANNGDFKCVIEKGENSDRCCNYNSGRFMCNTKTCQLDKQALENCKKDFSDLAELCNAKIIPEKITISTTVIDALIEGMKTIISDLDVKEPEGEHAYRNLQMLRNRWISSLLYNRPAIMSPEEFADIVKGIMDLEKMKDLTRQAEFKKAGQKAKENK